MNDEDYRVVRAGSISDLQIIVNLALREGWACQGGVAVASKNWMDDVYLQAMTRTPASTSKGETTG